MKSIGIRSFLFLLGLGSSVLLVLTTEGVDQALSAVAAVVAIFSAFLAAKLLYRRSRQKQAQVQQGSATDPSIDNETWGGWRLLGPLGGILGPLVTVTLNPLFAVPAMSFILLVPAFLIDVAAKDPSNSRIR